MKPQDCFGVVVRSLGLLILVGGLLYVYSTFVALAVPDGPNTSPVWQYLVAALVLLLASSYLLRGAPQLVRYAYGDRTKA